MIPYLSAPLIKDIRTGEGILEWVVNGGLAVAAATSNLSVARTALYITIVTGLKGIRRGLLKLRAMGLSPIASALPSPAPAIEAIFPSLTGKIESAVAPDPDPEVAP